MGDLSTVSVVPLSRVDPYCTALSVSCIRVRALRCHTAGPRCSHWELIDEHGTAAHLRVFASHGLENLLAGGVFRIDGLEVSVDPTFSSVSDYILCTTFHTRCEKDPRPSAVFPVERQIVPGCIRKKTMRLYDLQGLVQRVDRLTQKKSAVTVGSVRVFTGPGCPRIAPGQFVRLFGVSRMGPDRVYVSSPASQIDFGKSDRSSTGAIPVEDIAPKYRRQGTPMTVDVVGRLATQVHKKGPAFRTVSLRATDGKSVPLDVKKVPLSEIKNKKIGDCMTFKAVHVYFKPNSTVAYWTNGTSELRV